MKSDLGTCPYCGEDLVERKHGWGCSNYQGGCKAFIFKDDNFYRNVIGRKITKKEALTLIMGGTVNLKDVVIKGKQQDINLTWGKNPEGSKYPFGYHIEYLNNEVKE